MHTIYQEDGYGCGAACFAMLTGISYEEARQILFNGRRPDRNGIEREALAEALRNRGYDFGETCRIRAGSIADLAHHALVHGWLTPTRGYVSTENRESHWLVWDGNEKTLRDPWCFKKPIWLTHYNIVSQQHV